MKMLSKKIGVLCGLSFCAMVMFSVNGMEAHASETVAVEEKQETRSTNLTWVYATFDGVEYMRLYDHSTGEWLTDWIPAVG